MPPLRLAAGEPSRSSGTGDHGRELAGAALDPAPQQDAEPAQPAEPRDRQVALHRLPEEQALALAVVRDVEDACVDGAPRRVQGHLPPRTSIAPEAFGTSPPSARRTVLVPDPTCPARPVMIPLSSVSDTSSTLPGDVEPVDPHHLACRTRHGVLVLDLRLRSLHLAEHVLDQRAPVDLRDLVRPDPHPVPEHRHAVAELEDLVEPVRDEDHAATLRDELAGRPEHPLDLRLAQRRGRLVEDEQAGVADEQARDLDELALADREGLDRSAEPHVAEPELVEDAPGLLGETAPSVEERHVEPAEEDVVLDAELGHEAQLLVHERDPVRLGVVRVPERELLAVEADHPLVGPDQADEGLHEGALAGAVVPADRVHLADPDVERKAPGRP